jgi:phosphate/sulfate permease
MVDINKIFLWLVYIYTVVMCGLKIWKAEIVSDVSWTWVVLPFWAFVLGPYVFKFILWMVNSRVNSRKRF